MIERTPWSSEPVLKPEDESGADKPVRLPDDTRIDTIGTTVRVLNYMGKNGCETLGDMRRKITGAKLALDGLNARSVLYREILKLFKDTGSELRDANNDNPDKNGQ